MNLIKGQDIVILLYANEEYIQIVPDSVPDYDLFPANIPITPKETLWTVKDDEHCDTDSSNYITDGNDVPFYQINGPRPRNIVKR